MALLETAIHGSTHTAFYFLPNVAAPKICALSFKFGNTSLVVA